MGSHSLSLPLRVDFLGSRAISAMEGARGARPKLRPAGVGAGGEVWGVMRAAGACWLLCGAWGGTELLLKLLNFFKLFGVLLSNILSSLGLFFDPFGRPLGLFC